MCGKLKGKSGNYQSDHKTAFSFNIHVHIYVQRCVFICLHNVTVFNMKILNFQQLLTE